MNPIYDDIISAYQIIKKEEKIKFVRVLNEELTKAIQRGKDCVQIDYYTSPKELQLIFKEHFEIFKPLKEKGYSIETNMFKSEVEKKHWYIHIYWNSEDKK